MIDELIMSTLLRWWLKWPLPDNPSHGKEAALWDMMQLIQALDEAGYEIRKKV